MNKLQYFLCKLAEEASEVSQIALKTQQFGLLERHPQMKENNLQRIHLELDDLNAIIDVLNENYSFEYSPNSENIKNKKEKLNKYLRYSINLGMVYES